jgi:hypothetical protein
MEHPRHTWPEPRLDHQVINDMSQTLPYYAMGSSPIRHWVIHELIRKGCPDLPVALCSGAKGVDNPRIRNAKRFQRSRLWSSTSLVATTSYNPISQTLCPYYSSPLLFTYPFLCIISTPDPRCLTSIHSSLLSSALSRATAVV